MRKSLGVPTHGFVVRKNKTDNSLVDIYLRVTYGGRSSERSVYSNCPEKGWSRSKQQFTKHCEGWFGLNEMIKAYEIRGNEYIIKCERSGAAYSFDDFFVAVFPNRHQKSVSNLFCDVMDLEVAEMKKAGRFKRAYTIGAVKTSLLEYKPKMTIGQIDTETLNDIKAFYKSRGLAESTIRLYFATIRSVCNSAIGKGLMPESWEPFKKFKVGAPMKAAKARARSIEDIRKIATVALAGKALVRYRDMFMLSFFLRGMNLIDMCRFKIKDIKDGRIVYGRSKTGSQISVAVTDAAMDIIKRHSKGLPGSCFFDIFDEMGESKSDNFRRRLTTFTSQVNENIKKVARIAGVEDPDDVVFYTARHSIATILSSQNIPLSSISQVLGHSKTATTETYIGKQGNAAIDSALADLFDKVGE